jgi:hypothetical protein
LDYIVETSPLDQNIIDRYKVGSENYKVYLIENKLNSALNNIDLPEDVKRDLLGTFEYVKALDPVLNFDFLDLLDIIISDIPDLSFALKSFYSQASLISRNIKLDKLNNAISTFAKNIELETNEKIVALIDTSIWDDTKEGIILTDKQVIYKNGWDDTQIEKYESLTKSASYSVSSCLISYDVSQFAKFLLNLKEQKLALS